MAPPWPLNYSGTSLEPEIGSCVIHSQGKRSYMPHAFARSRSLYPYDYGTILGTGIHLAVLTGIPIPYQWSFWNPWGMSLVSCLSPIPPGAKSPWRPHVRSQKEVKWVTGTKQGPEVSQQAFVQAFSTIPKVQIQLPLNTIFSSLEEAVGSRAFSPVQDHFNCIKNF